MFFSRIKPEERFQFTINLVMVVLVITSISLTIIESVDSVMTPELRDIFLSIHVAILAAFFAEFLYRMWHATQTYEGDAPVKAALLFLVHPLTIIDIIVIAPLFGIIWTHNLHDADMVILRVLRFTSILNIFHFYRSSRVIKLIKDMGKEIWFEMMVIFLISLQCLVISGVIFYALEHGTNPHVKSIFDGLWWAVVTLTTIGYGDVYPITFGGRIVAMILAFVGIGLVALPTGILTSGFIRALRSEKKISQLVDTMEEEEKEQSELMERVQEIESTIKKTKKPSLSSSKIFKKKKKGLSKKV